VSRYSCNVGTRKRRLRLDLAAGLWRVLRPRLKRERGGVENGGAWMGGVVEGQRGPS